MTEAVNKSHLLRKLMNARAKGGRNCEEQTLRDHVVVKLVALSEPMNHPNAPDHTPEREGPAYDNTYISVCVCMCLCVCVCGGGSGSEVIMKRVRTS